MEYVVFSCTQGKKGGGTDILDLICVLNISLLCWFCVSTSSKFQLSITLGKKLHLYEVVLHNRGSKTRYGKKSFSYEAATLEFLLPTLNTNYLLADGIIIILWNLFEILNRIRSNQKFYVFFFYSIILQKILDKTFPVKT